MLAVGFAGLGFEKITSIEIDKRALALLSQLVTVLVVIVRARGAGLGLRSLFGDRPSRATLPLLILVVPLLLFTYGAYYVVFVALSYELPEWVAQHIAEPTFFHATTGFQLGVLVFTIVVGAPLAEEILFRGVLLQRWARRWGTARGVIASSALFAVLHDEWLGHFVVGVGLAALFLRTRSLWLPVAAHALHNLTAAVPIVWSFVTHQPPEPTPTLAELRDELFIGQLALLGALVLLWFYLHLYWPNRGLQSALTGPTPYDATHRG